MATLEGLLVLAQLAYGPTSFDLPGLPLGLPVRAAGLASTALLLSGFLWLSLRARLDRPWLVQAATWLQRLATRDGCLRFALGAFYLLVLANIIGLFGVSLRLNLDAGNLIQAYLRRGLLPLLWLALMTLHASAVLGASGRVAARRWLKAFAAGGIALGLLLLYWYGAEGQLLFYNVDMRLTDQSAYMEYARLLRQTGYTYPGDFNRMPVYPYILSLAFRPGMSEAAFFVAAKYLNLFLSMALLAALAVVIFRRFARLRALNLVLIIGFTVFIYKAGWVQAELLFYFINTCLFLLMWRLLMAPTYPLAIAAGIAAGLAHLTKASIWPSLALFAVLGLWRGASQWRQAARSVEAGPSRAEATRAILVVPLSLALFLAVIFPYVRVSKRITDHYFYNVNSTFYLWYDSWEDAEAGTKAYGDRVGWPDMPPQEIPSLANYVHGHTAAQMVERVLVGAQDVVDHVLRSYGYLDYVMLYGGLLILAVAWKGRRAWDWLSRNLSLTVFFVAYFMVYFLLYSWYAPIAAGDRLILAQFIPMLLVLSSGVESLLAGERLRLRRGSISWSTVLNLVVLCLIAVDVFRALTRGVYVLRGGG